MNYSLIPITTRETWSCFITGIKFLRRLKWVLSAWGLGHPVPRVINMGPGPPDWGGRGVENPYP